MLDVPGNYRKAVPVTWVPQSVRERLTLKSGRKSPMIRAYGTAGSALGKLSGSVVSGSWSWRSGFHPKANVVAYHKCNLDALPTAKAGGFLAHFRS